LLTTHNNKDYKLKCINSMTNTNLRVQYGCEYIKAKINFLLQHLKVKTKYDVSLLKREGETLKQDNSSTKKKIN